MEDDYYFILKENNNYSLAISPNYPGKSLVLSNGELQLELSDLFNSKF
jgi:hypothetical protein